MNQLRLASSRACLFLAGAALAAASRPALAGGSLEPTGGGGGVELHAVDRAHLCFGADCPLQDAGREAKVAVVFPDGQWTRVLMTLTVDSNATVESSADCNYPNRTGDIFDRSASVFLVLDESCVDSTCVGTAGQLELLKAVTPFGTDARVGPRRYTIDVTPFAALLSGTKFVGVWIDTYDRNGWYADVDFSFTADPEQASPKPPATGVAPLFFKRLVSTDSQPTIEPVSVTVPDTATQVMVRLFTTGHGGVGTPPCDEFCQRNNQLLVDGNSVWERVVWRTDCSPFPGTCRNWNACGYPSCTFSRSGWCPGYVACHANQFSGGPPCDQDIDVTVALPPGETHDLLYAIQNITPGGYWNYSIVLYWY